MKWQIRVLLIDADSTIPNLALMKLSAYYKWKFGAKVDLLRLKIPYYPNKVKRYHQINSAIYNYVYCSVIFEGSFKYIECNSNNVVFGGTGYDLSVKLPEDIENFEPDYALYNAHFFNDTSYGFISRGCIRNCSFCKVHAKEGSIKQVSTINKIVRHDKVKFFDNNILALPNHKEILKELMEVYVKCEFNQGLDIRLLDEENSYLLSMLNYSGEYVFAFDDIKLESLIEKKLKLAEWRKPWQFKFFVYVHPEMDLGDTVKRIEWLKQRQLLPYIMRHVSCWNSEYSDFYVDIAAYCNQVFAFKKLDFEQFLRRRHDNEERISQSLLLWNQHKGEFK